MATVTLLASGESGLAVVPCAFPAQPAGTILMLTVVGDAYKLNVPPGAGDPPGWTQPTPEVQANHGLNCWLHESTGVEASATYQLGVPARSAWAVYAITDVDLLDIIDGVAFNLSNAGGSSVVGDPVLTSAGAKLALQIVGASHGGAVFTGIDTWLNSYVEAGQSLDTVVPGLAVGVAALVLAGGGNTSSGATFQGPTAQARTSITLVLNLSALQDADLPIELPLGFTAVAQQIQESSPNFELPLAFEAEALIEDENIQDANGVIDLPLNFSAVALIEGENIQDANGIIDLPLAFTALAFIEDASVQDASFPIELPLGFVATAVKVIAPPTPGDCVWPIPDPECCAEWDGATDLQRERAKALASEFLWAESGRQFGICEQTVLPCGLACPCTVGPCHLGGGYQDYDGPYGFSYSPALLPSGQVTNVSCSDCRCCSPCEIALPGTVEEILSVTVDGQLVPADAYVVYDHKFLARIDGQCWPDCQDFGAPAAFLVRYNEGIPVPYGGLQAASDLACTLLRTCPDLVDCGSCMTDSIEASVIVSTWLKQVNPNGLSQDARLIVPGVRGTEDSHRRVTWSS